MKENIGYSTVRDAPGSSSRPATLSVLHRDYMNSPRHRANILGDAVWSGIGAVSGPTDAQLAAGHCSGVTANSVMWNTQVFVK